MVEPDYRQTDATTITEIQVLQVSQAKPQRPHAICHTHPETEPHLNTCGYDTCRYT